MQPDDILTTVSTSRKRLASPVESVNKRNRMTENVDEILEVEDEIRQTKSKPNNLIKSTVQSASHSLYSYFIFFLNFTQKFLFICL